MKERPIGPLRGLRLDVRAARDGPSRLGFGGVRRRFSALCLALLVGCGGGCTKAKEGGDGASTSAADPVTKEFERMTRLLRTRADALVFEEEGGGAVVVSPALQGRIMTARVGKVASVGYVNEALIEKGESDLAFHNFGGVDRFWLSPEAGQFGLYFAPGAEMTRESWIVPRDFDTGPFRVVVGTTPGQVSLARDMKVRNYQGVELAIQAQREIGLIKRAEGSSELGVTLESGTSYIGYYSLNVITNAGEKAWERDSGLVGIWILGMFEATPRTVVIAPFRAGSESELGPIFNDDYFGKVTEESPERLKTADDAVLFLADASRVGKFGLSQKRTTGVAGAYDFSRDLLTIVKFDVPVEPALYGNSQWQKEQADPYGGDVFQSYNNGVAGEPGKRAPDAFYELESASPVRPLAPGESIRHRHATFHLQGPRAELARVAKSVLGVELDEVARAFEFRD